MSGLTVASVHEGPELARHIRVQSEQLKREIRTLQVEGDPEPALTLTTKAGIEEIRALGRFHGEFDEVRPEGGVVRLVPIGAARR